MTLRISQPNLSHRKPRSIHRTQRDRLRRKRHGNRHSLLESLENRQLLAGPDLIGIQPNEGALLFDNSTLTVSPRQLVFQFDDNADIDPATLSAIRITRAGEDAVFESATATSDLGTSGQILMEFRAAQTGSLGNGVQVEFTTSTRNNSSFPLITVSDRLVTIDVNDNPNRPTRAQDLISAVRLNDEAAALIEVIQVSGPSQGVIGTTVTPGLTLTLTGANAAQAVTDFGTGSEVTVRLVSQLPGVDGRGTQIQFEQRNFGGQANPVVVVNGNSIRVQLNSASGFETTAAEFITAINTNPEASRVVLVFHEQGDINTTVGDQPTAGYSPLALAGVSDVAVVPGFVGLGDSTREVIFRFAETQPDDIYQIDILGSGPFALRNVDGELFQDGVDLTRQFNINLGPQVVAVVPEPIRRNPNTGALSPETGRIEVHFNDDDLDPLSAENPDFYQLIFTRDTVDNTDDVIVTPTSVEYSNITNIALLDFSRPLSRIPDPASPGQFLEGAARLRVGSGEGLPSPPTEVSLLVDPNNPVEPGDTFDTAFNLNDQWAIGAGAIQSARLNSEIFNTQPFDLDLPGPGLPGTRNIRPDDPSRLERTVPLDYVRNGADVVDGISIIQYNFASSWLGDDPNRPGILEDKTYFNGISGEQKDRVREAMQLYSEYLGVSFIEVEGDPTNDAFISIAVGDLYGGDERAVSGDGGVAVVTRDRNGDGIDDLGVMDFQDFDESVDDQFGGEFFRGAMFVVGQLLGYGYADDLPQPVTQSTSFIFTPGTDNEPAFPSVADIVNGQYLYRPDSTDIDLYRFTVNAPGKLSVETLAERLGSPSLLDTALRLYRLDGNGAFNEFAGNGDYFSNDSLIDVEIEAGTYVVGVSARGNTSYDPNIESSGFGGLSEGEYELRLDFRPNLANAIIDTTGVALDGDGDSRPGGFFDFWFVPSDPNNTLYVDKSAGPLVNGQTRDLVPDTQVLSPAFSLFGQIGNPYNEIDDALARAAAQRGFTTIRIVGNGGIDGRIETAQDNFSYQIGNASNGLPLSDGATMDLPQGVRVIIDSGAVLKLSGSRIGVGSVSPLIDVSDSSLQILGLPSIITANGLPARDSTNAIIPGSVYLTSINDDTLGAGNTPTFTPQASAGDWGGIDFRGDLDAADESRRNRELEGVFLNYVQNADIRFGGGSISFGGRLIPVSPIDMAITRPTIIKSRITNSADAAIAATPDTFAETRFTTPLFQDGGTFTPDYTRVGPAIFGNYVADNSFNGLFVRVRTRSGNTLETISTSVRFDDTDIPHILTENLVITGTPGGPILQSSAPSSLLVRPVAIPVGDVPAGSYVYRITNVDTSGLESAASQQTISVTLSAPGGIQLSQLPAVNSGSGFASRRLYRATLDPGTGLPGQFRLVEQLNASDTFFVDRDAVGTTLLTNDDVVLRSRLDGRLAIDPGTVVKIKGARIEARFGANLLAEGAPGLPIVFTSLDDSRYGSGGTFDTNGRGQSGQLTPGDWSGIYLGHGSSASIDQAVIAGAGGASRIAGGFASFNPIEVHQASLRLANTQFDQNADGRGSINGTRVGRGDNASGTLFVRASTPVIINNDFTAGSGPAMTFDVNSLNSNEVSDGGRATGQIDTIDVVGNSGPLVQGNTLQDNTINGLQVRGGQLATAGVWDDVDVVHVVTDSIDIPNKYILGGLRLQSDARGSLVVKFESSENETAGIVVGGSLLTGTDELRDIPDRIGGALQLIGHPDFPVVLTTLADDFAGAGFTRDGLAQVDTNNDGVAGGTLAEQRFNVSPGGAGTPTGPSFVVLPTGPEVNRGLTIDNDVNINTPGYFEATPGAGNQLTFLSSGVTVQDLSNGQILVNQNYVFAYSTFIQANGAVANLATSVTQAPTLIADDVVESRGTFVGQNGNVDWVATSSFVDGVATFFTSLEMSAATGTLGDIRVHSYLDEDVEGISDDILVTLGTPGEADFRALTIDGVRRIGFSQGGFYIDDGVNLSNATYAGWAADRFNDLQTLILAGNAVYTLPGTIDLADLPVQPDPVFGTSNGPGDVTTAFAWDTLATATTATVTSFLELIPTDPGVSTIGPETFEPGLWNGVVIRESADDRNVAAISEQEPIRTSVFNTNSIPSQSQFLGEIAPSEAAGDENRRLGFIIDGAIATRNDIDVYSFIGESGTEVWLDIDRTGNQLDTVVELIDANGRVLAASNDSLLAETDPAALFVNTGVNPDAAQSLSVVSERLQSQEITISESIVDATGGDLTLSIAGSDTPVLVPVDVFLTDPAAAIESALETQYGAELGTIVATLQRRTARQVDPNDPSLITRGGDDFVVLLRFDETLFVGRSVPLVAVDTSAVIGAGVVASVDEVLLGSQLQDDYSSNAKDAGMRIRLPGEAGTRNLYHIRVRSSNTRNPLDFATLVDPGNVQDGLSKGRYELQIRLQEGDESPGTQVRLADIRYATTGLQIIGQPLHSPLLGEDQETNAANDLLADAQPLGYLSVGDDVNVSEAGPLQSDRLAKSFAGVLDSGTDVDWYRFEINYENLTRDSASLYLSTVFDLDYASNFARADMALYVFDSDGRLVLVGGDSNIADDQPGRADSNDTGDLSRGSAGVQDPYIGASELSEGVYFVAVANQQQVPLPLDQFFNAQSANPLLRLEPVDSVRRIAEDRIGSFGGGTASAPVTEVLFDNNSIVDYSFDDTLLYVNTVNGLLVVNPFTGQTYGTVGNFDNTAGVREEIRDIAFRANGELFAYSGYSNRPAGDQNWFYYRIDTGDASLSAPLSTGAGITTFNDLNIEALNPILGILRSQILDQNSNDGLEVEAIAIGEFLGQEDGFFVGNRPAQINPSNGQLVPQQGNEYVFNILYDFDETSGLATGPGYDRSRFDQFGLQNAGAGTSPREIGQINTVAPAGLRAQQLGVTNATEVNPAGVGVPSLFDGDTFTLSNVTVSQTFELDQSFTLIADGSQPVRDGDAVVIDGVVFELNTGQRLIIDDLVPVGTLTEGDTVTVAGSNGETATFEFVGLGQPRPGNIPIATSVSVGQSLPINTIVANLAAAINANVTGLGALAGGQEIFFTADAPTALAETGSGVTIAGDDTTSPGAIPVQVSETIGTELLIQRLAAAIRSQGISVSAAGTQLALPSAAVVSVQPDPLVSASALTLTGSPGVSGSNVSIALLPTDTAATISQRISAAVQAADNSGDLPGVSAIPQGRSLRITGGFVANATGNLTVGGVSPQGNVQVPLVQGIELVNDRLYAVTDTGGLFEVLPSELTFNDNRQVGRYVTTATDLVGINFTGLRSGPVSVEGGSLDQMLFGITGDGDVYAFNTRGELQPVFAGGRNVISTGISGALGLDFSVVDFNLWNVTAVRGEDPGHGIDPIFNGTRGAEAGGNSLAFSYQASAFGSNYPSLVEQPTFAPRQDGTLFENSYNVPGGTKGVVQSNSFSLDGYGADDEPMMYFNYFIDTDGGADRLRVYVLSQDGAEHLVASNTLARGGGSNDDEFDDPAVAGIYDDAIDVEVQQLFDNTGSWRQARVPLSEFAGQDNLSLRIEFSTSGSTATGSPAFRTVAGEQLVEGQQLVVGGETFVIDLSPQLTLPAGVDLATLYVDPNEIATVVIDGQEYVLDDGSRTISPGQIAVDLLANFPSGATLADLAASQIASAVADAVRRSPPTEATLSGFDLSDPSDDLVSTQRNDLTYEATVLPYGGGNLTIEGSGRIGTIDSSTGLQSDFNDVDLSRVVLLAGTTVDITASFVNLAALQPVIRVFDAGGDEVTTTLNVATNTVQYTTTVDGPIFIGLSGPGNSTYDPRILGTATSGQTDDYTAVINFGRPLAILAVENVVEFNGVGVVSATPPSLFNVLGQQAIDGIPIRVSRFMTASEVAVQAQLAIANRFVGGEIDYLPTRGSSVKLPGLTLQDSGPFADEGERYGDNFGGGIVGVRDNANEGVYLDDFIIGFAERGELATGSDIVSAAFVSDLSPQFPLPADPTSNLSTGSYQVEIRDASEYVDSESGSRFRTFGTNERLTDSRSIVSRSADQLIDGGTFSIFDGRSTVTFEFDLEESSTGATPGRVRIPFTLLAVEPGTEEIDPNTGFVIPGSGTIRPQTAAEVAQRIIDAINQADVQSVINVPALRSTGIDGITDDTINLYGDVVVDNRDGALASVDRGILRGDDNRDRDAQGVILIENSRFLFNEVYGLDISHDTNVDVDGVNTLSVVRYPRNLVELNSESLKPGVVVQSNVFSFNGVGGLRVAGIDPTLLESGNDPVPFERIVNNTFIGGSVSVGSTSPSATFEGIFFDQGTLSFADSVTEYLPDAGGAPPDTIHQVPDSALGAPDGTGRGPEPIDGTTSVSIGIGGSLTLEFVDNLLTGSGDARPDLVVFETGAVESVRVEISRDGLTFTEVGILGGLTNQLDIDAAGFDQEDRFAFVRLTDLRQGRNTGTSLGADIDAVGALSTVPVDTFTAGGTAIVIAGNAAPALLNNVISNSELGIDVDPANTAVVMGGNTFYRNTENVPQGVSLGEFSQTLSNSETVFVAPAELIFAPAAGAAIIDSSIDSLEDRPSLTTVKNPLGLPPSPILAPRLDVNGQLRVDDPNVETPSGLGERVFKDRGASDRGDLVGPRAVLLTPTAPNLGLSAGMVSVFGPAPDFFEIQLIDGLAPADVVPGTGIDDRTISSDAILVLKDNIALVEGIDYRFGYNPSTNVIRITPIAGVWEENSTYVLRLIDDTDAIIAASRGDGYTDADRLDLLDLGSQPTQFEYETGITLTLSESLTGPFADGITFDVFDGTNLLEFELDNDQIFDADRNIIQIPDDASPAQIVVLIANVINQTPALDLTATSSLNSVQLLGNNPLAFVTTPSSFVSIAGSIGTSIGFGIQIPADGARPADTISDGDVFIVRRGALREVVFEIDNDNIVDTPGATGVAIPLNATLDDIADAMVRAIGGARLGLNPVNTGFGRVFLGGDSNYNLDLTGSAFTQIGVAGDVATVPIVVQLDLTAGEVARVISDTIDAEQLGGVSTNVVDTRVFVEGTGGVSGVGAVQLVTIADEVGNQLQDNQANGRTELSIFIGGGVDFGDAPSPYTSTEAEDGPRHSVDSTFALWRPDAAIPNDLPITPDADAKLPDADDDNGIRLVGAIQPGFVANFEVSVHNEDGRVFYVDAWFDWNANGLFESGEVLRFGSVGTGRSVLGVGTNVIAVNVPANASVGEIYARFRLSEDSNLGPNGSAPSGEVEDIRLQIANNPFRNPDLRHDVNDSDDVTPIDALQIINAIGRNDGNPIFLDAFPLPANLPVYPDVSGDGVVTALDALQVINELARLPNTVGGAGEFMGEGESTSYVQLGSGLMASGETVIGDVLIAETLQTRSVPRDEPAPGDQVSNLVTEPDSKTSVFDDAAVVALDLIVESLAEDTATVRAEGENDALDDLFAAL